MKRYVQPLSLVALYAAVAVAMTWPLCTSLSSALPIGCERVSTVPLLNTWTVWWNANRADYGFQQYWDAPIFVPERTTFAFSEAQPTTVVVAPVVWATGNAALAYNLYLLTTLVLNGWCADRLLRRVGLGGWAAYCGGVMTQILPWICWQLGVLQLDVLWGVLWTTHAAWSFAQSPSWKKAAGLGVAFGVAYLACNYYGLFLAVLLGPAALWMLRYRSIVGWAESATRVSFAPPVKGGVDLKAASHPGLTPPNPPSERGGKEIVTTVASIEGETRRLVPPCVKWLLQSLLAATVAAAIVSPIAIVQWQVSRQHGWKREWNNIRDLSAHLRDYTDSPWHQWLDALEDDTPPRADQWPLGPGWLKVFGAAIGLVCGLARPSLRRWTLAAATMGTLAFLYSLGPHLEVWNLTPYRFLFDYVPGFAQIRSPFRFAVFVQLACVWLSAVAVDTLSPRHWLSILSSLPRLRGREFERGGCPGASHEVDGGIEVHPLSLTLSPADGGEGTGVAWQRLLLIAAGWLPAIALGVCLIAETVPYPQDPLFLRQLPPQNALPPWIEFLRNETPRDAAVVCLPFVTGIDVGHYEGTAWWMWWGTFHHRRLLNGYSGYFPEPFLTLKGELENFPNQGAPRLAEMGASFAVVERRAWSQEKLKIHPQTSHWKWRFGDDLAGIDVYEIPPQR